MLGTTPFQDESLSFKSETETTSISNKVQFTHFQ